VSIQPIETSASKLFWMALKVSGLDTVLSAMKPVDKMSFGLSCDDAQDKDIETGH